MSTPAPLPKKGVAAPGYTQIPNEILEAMPKMKEAELRITLAIARKTFGWHKRKDKLSHSQLKDLTGLSKQGVQNGLDDALKRGFIDREPASRQQFFYFLVVNEVDQIEDKAVNLVGQTSQPSRPEPVNVVGTQKKDKETNKKKNGGGNSSLASDNPSPPPPPTAAATVDDDSFIAINSALTAINKGLKKPFTGLPELTRILISNGKTVADVQALWRSCQNKQNPAGAFIHAIKNNFTPNTRPAAASAASTPKPKYRRNPTTGEIEEFVGTGWGKAYGVDEEVLTA